MFGLYFFSISSVYANLKVGTLYFDPPFVLSPGEGLDIDLTQLICKKLNQKCDLIPMDFNQFYPALNDGKIDFAIGGIAISSSRAQNYIFSTPYMISEGQFLVLVKSKLTSINDLNGSTVGVIRGDPQGGVTYDYLVNTYSGKFKLKEYDDVEDLVTALNSNEISAAFVHRSSAVYWVQNGGNQFMTLGKPVIIGDGDGIMALPKNAAWIERINQILQGMEKDNTLINLYNTYLFTQ